MADENNIRSVVEVMGDQGRVAQGAQNELLISLLRTELGFSLAATLTSIPSVVVSSMPSLTIGSVPSLTANPTKPVSLAHGLMAASIGTLYTFAAAHRSVVIHVCNVDTVERTFTIQINATTPGVADDTHTRVKTHRLDVGDWTQIVIPGAATSDVIYGLCDSANKVSFEIWGIP